MYDYYYNHDHTADHGRDRDMGGHRSLEDPSNSKPISQLSTYLHNYVRTNSVLQLEKTEREQQSEQTQSDSNPTKS